MREYPILFSPPMVSAILLGRKTNTRRIVTAKNSTVLGQGVTAKSPLWTGLVWGGGVSVDISYPNWQYLHVPWVFPTDGDDGRVYRVRSRMEIGDRFWVKETWWTPLRNFVLKDLNLVAYKANYQVISISEKWKPSLFMPRWASRITLEIRAVKAQRVNEISEEEAIAEGFATREEFFSYWDSLNAKRYSVEINPWVWAYTFRRLME